jgi:Na+-translocating ferredoxin:NAD+ oxidoreductase RnfG subunit
MRLYITLAIVAARAVMLVASATVATKDTIAGKQMKKNTTGSYYEHKFVELVNHL